MELDLTLTPQTIHAGDAVTATLTLRHTAESAALVNTRLAVNRPGAPVGFRDVSFVVTGPDGVDLPLAVKVNVGAPRERDFRLLEPREAVTRTVDLHKLYDLSRPGAYRIRATYRGESDPGDGRTAWHGIVESPLAGLRVEPAA